MNARINNSLMAVDGFVDQRINAELDQRHPILTKINRYFREHPRARMWMGVGLTVAGFASLAVGAIPLAGAFAVARGALTGAGVYSGIRGFTQNRADRAMREAQQAAPGNIEAQTGARVERTRKVRRGKRVAAAAGVGTAGVMTWWGLTHLPPSGPNPPGPPGPGDVVNNARATDINEATRLARQYGISPRGMRALQDNVSPETLRTIRGLSPLKQAVWSRVYPQGHLQEWFLSPAAAA